MTGLLKDDAEQAVLGGLKRALLNANSFKRFRKEYAQALKDANKSLRDDQIAVARQLRSVEAEIAKGNSAILSGVNSSALSEAMAKAETRKADLLAKQREFADPKPMLPTDLEAVYAEHVRKLEKS